MSRATRVERDEFVDKAFEAVGIPLIRFENKRNYILSEVKEKIDILFVGVETSMSEQKINLSDNEEIPICPKCGIPMVISTAKAGKNAGKSFYSCSNCPKCREIIRID
ncbi:MAG: DUF2726 domain-containing protein [Tepidanaerobacteraceae bacterium]|nr:DUF2726 domain-containing protein [Tepidanaerobacteraceae bacterium]